MSRQHQPHKSHSTHPVTAASATSSTTPPATDVSNESTSDRVRMRAYEISLARNGSPGDANTDWAQAEQELTLSDTVAL